MPMMGVIAMIASAAISAHSQSQAAKKQKQQMVQAQQRQLNAQNAATDVAMKRVAEFDPDTRKANQDAIQQELQGGYEKEVAAPQITAQGVQVGNTIEGGTPDYLTTKAREKSKATESLRQLAALMGRTGSASQLRRNEAESFGRASDEIGRIGDNAHNMFEIDKVGAAAAGRPSVGATIGAAALNAYGRNQMATSGLGATRTNDMPFLAKATGADPTAWWLRNGVGGD